MNSLIQVTTPMGKNFLIDQGSCKADKGQASEIKIDCQFKNVPHIKYSQYE